MALKKFLNYLNHQSKNGSSEGLRAGAFSFDSGYEGKFPVSLGALKIRINKYILFYKDFIT